MTALVWTFLAPSERDRRQGQSLERRLRAVLASLRKTRRRKGAVVTFEVHVVDFGERRTWRLQAVVSTDEEGEPVVTIMFPHEA